MNRRKIRYETRNEAPRRDGTGKKRLEAAFFEEDGLYRSLFDDSSLGIVILADTLRISKANKAFCDIMGYSPQEMETLTLRDLTHPMHLLSEKKIMRAMARCTDTVSMEEKRFISKAGDVVWANVHIAAVCGKAKKPIYYQVVIEDITAHKRAEAELAEQNVRNMEKAKTIQLLKDQFVFIAAHELRAPVTALSWATELMKDSITKNGAIEPDIAQSVSLVEESVARLNALVNELLEVSRIEYGTFKVNPAKFDPRAVIRYCVKVIRHEADERSITVDVAPTANDLPMAMGDRIFFGEVLTNLLSNAIKYNSPGGRVTVSVIAGKEHLLVGVEDTGLGLSAEDISQLFRKFSRIKNEATKKITGTGLGLYIAKLVVERMGGTISVESAGRGKGSTFSFTVPIA
jgi:PAS domain S-box-containing protein